MDRIIIATIIVTTVMLFSIIIVYAEEPDIYWYVPNKDTGEIKVFPVYYVEEEFNCKYFGSTTRGCFNGALGYIMLVKSTEFDYVIYGCTVRDHEFFHAMGYNHGEGPLGIICSNPNIAEPTDDNMNYDETNWKHKDLTKDYKVVVEINPRMISWNIGENIG